MLRRWVLLLSCLSVSSSTSLTKLLPAVTDQGTDRYFGQSSPWDGLDSETLQYLTTDQAAADVVNFAQNIVFPFDKNQTSISPKAVSTPCPDSTGLDN
jgi:hypothetical protein